MGTGGRYKPNLRGEVVFSDKRELYQFGKTQTMYKIVTVCSSRTYRWVGILGHGPFNISEIFNGLLCHDWNSIKNLSTCTVFTAQVLLQYMYSFFVASWLIEIE